MTATAHDKAATRERACVAQRNSRRWLSAPNVFIAALVVAGGALYLGWSALVAAGIASVIVGVLPCLAMCVLGLCMGRMGKKDAAIPTSNSLPPDGEESRQPQSKVQR